MGGCEASGSGVVDAENGNVKSRILRHHPAQRGPLEEGRILSLEVSST